jgi:phosphate starvation-inducible PhoH-like protein
MKKSKSLSNPNLYYPKTLNQEKYVKCLDDLSSKIIVSLGPAGTGKTMFACQKAITQLKSENIDKIIITRPVVTVEEEIGFLPGNIIKKMDPWTKPIFDIFLEYYSKSDLDVMLYSNKIEICPLAFMRGRTFKNAFIIADEMQNSSPNQMKMLVTRLGHNSKMVITGDLHQSDIKGDNGLHDFIFRFENHQSKNNKTNLIHLVHLKNEDIERSDVVKKVIEIYDYKEEKVKQNILNTTNIIKDFDWGTSVIKKEILNEVKKETNETKKETSEPKKETKLAKIPFIDNDAALMPIHHCYKF